MKKLFFIIFILISEFCIAQIEAKVKVGDHVLLFSGKTVDGNEIQLKNLIEENPVVFVVLRGWPGYQCPICTRQVGGLVGEAEKFQELNATVLMVYPGPAEQLIEHATEFAEDFNFPSNFFFILDPDYSIINKYGIRWNAPRETAYPSTYIIDQKEKIVYVKISTSHGERAENEEIFEALNQLK